MTDASPIDTAERVLEIDIIRGFALFGVLWLNLVTQSYMFVPDGLLDDLPTASIDALMEPFASLFIANKALTLFSLLFGYGFAMIMHRLQTRGVNAGRIFLRRTAILLIIGLIHLLFVWIGDILHVYALMGFFLFLTRNWPDRRLLIVGLLLALFSSAAVELVLQNLYGWPYPWSAVYEAEVETRFAVLQGSSYFAYVAELWREAWQDVLGNPEHIPYCTTALGRFMIGAWIFRQGWLIRTAELGAEFRRWALFLVGSGILLSVIQIVARHHSDALGSYIAPLPQLILALGYAAVIVVICQSDKVRRMLRGFASVGRMALTNYLMQSLVYVFVLFGFGLGLLSILGATMCAAIAVVTFAFQMWLSSCWLSKFRFGPMEWLWRSLTYGQRQPILIAPAKDSSS